MAAASLRSSEQEAGTRADGTEKHVRQDSAAWEEQQSATQKDPNFFLELLASLFSTENHTLAKSPTPTPIILLTSRLFSPGSRVLDLAVINS